MRTPIIAHRGHSTAAPENTLAAFRAALACGADAVELDVQLSQDGVPVVIHDETLARTTGAAGNVEDLPLAQLQALDAGAWFRPAFAGERIPTLEAVFSLLCETRLTIHAELKTSRRPYPALPARVAALVAQYSLGERVVLSSFNPASLHALHALAPHLPRAALFTQETDWRLLMDQDLAALHPPHALCSAELVRACHSTGLAVRPWTVDDPAEAERLLCLGVDGLITNRPDVMILVRDRLQPPG